MSENRSSDPFAATAVAGSDATAATTAAGDGRPRDSYVMLEVGKRLGDRYDVLGYLGEGGMGAVYRAFDATLGEEVALKVVRGAFAHEAALRDEVRIAQKVTHENVCRTYDLEEIAGYQLVKMEYIAGDTLATRIAEQGALAVDEAVRIARAIVAGLEAAHARGIVHRDLKPGNVMLAGDRVVLMDFGLARHVTDEALERAGTPGYMSPEQLAGGRVTPASDLYALGCLLYEMLTGERAFAHGTMTEVATRRAAEAAPDLRAKRPKTPRWLVRATQLLMSDAAGPRAGGLALLADRTTKRRRIAQVAIVLGIGVLLGNAWYLYTLLRPAPAKPWAPIIAEVPVEYGQGTIDRPALSPDGKTLAFLIDRGYEGHGWIYTVPFPAGGVATPWPGPPRALHGFRWKDAHSFVVAAEENKTVQVGVLEGEQFTAWGPGHDPAWCNGTIVSLFDPYHLEPFNPKAIGDAVVMYAAKDARPRQLVVARDEIAFDHPRCDAKGRVVVSHFAPVGLALLDGDHRRELTTEVDHTPAFTRDGKDVVFTRQQGNEGEIYVREVDRDAASRKLTDTRSFLVALEPSPVDDNVLVFLRERPAAAIIVHDANGSTVITEDAEDFQDAIVLPANRGVLGTWQGIMRWYDNTGRHTDLGPGNLPVGVGARVYYQHPKSSDEVWAIALDGGKPTRVAKLPGRIVARASAADGAHFEVMVGEEARSFRVGADGAVHDDGHEGLGVPAPSGNWRAIRTAAETSFQNGTVVHTLACVSEPVWIDEHHAGCATGLPRERRLTVIDVRDGTQTIADDWRREYIAWALGANHYRVIVRRVLKRSPQYITNFASR